MIEDLIERTKDCEFKLWNSDKQDMNAFWWKCCKQKSHSQAPIFKWRGSHWSSRRASDIFQTLCFKLSLSGWSASFVEETPTCKFHRYCLSRQFLYPNGGKELFWTIGSIFFSSVRSPCSPRIALNSKKEVHGKAQQLPPLDENMSMAAQHDGSRSSSERIVSKHHYGLSSVKVPFNPAGGSARSHHDSLSVTRPDGKQTLYPDRFASSTQTSWLDVIRHTYDSSSDLRTKGFESSTLLATARTSDPVPHVAIRASAGDSQCGREPQKLLHGHTPPSQYQDERNTNLAMMSPSSSSNPRSRSIKIARTKRSEPDFEADTIDRNKSLYDAATWKMYNRITEYRRQHPINYDDMNMGGSGSSIHSKSPMFLPRKESSSLYGPRALNRVLMSVGPVTSREQHKLDGEVFDMDLWIHREIPESYFPTGYSLLKTSQAKQYIRPFFYSIPPSARRF